MPWFTLNHMSDRDLQAVYRYVRYLGPAGDPAPTYVVPGNEPRTPYIVFVPQNPKWLAAYVGWVKPGPTRHAVHGRDWSRDAALYLTPNAMIAASKSQSRLAEFRTGGNKLWTSFVMESSNRTTDCRGSVVSSCTATWSTSAVTPDPTGDIRTQTRQVLERIDRLLQVDGTDKTKLLSVSRRAFA